MKTIAFIKDPSGFSSRNRFIVELTNQEAAHIIPSDERHRMEQFEIGIEVDLEPSFAVMAEARCKAAAMGRIIRAIKEANELEFPEEKQ